MFRREALIMLLSMVGIVVFGLLLGIIGPRLFGRVRSTETLPARGRSPN